MSRALTVFQPLAGDPSALVDRFLGDPGTWLPGQARPDGPGAWRVELGVAQVSRPVRCTLGAPWRSREAWWRRMQWVPIGDEGDVLPVERLLPVLDADLGLVVENGSGRASLALTGTYEVPAALFGEAVDALGLGRVARRTAVRFLADVAAGLVGVAAEPAEPALPSA